ncbi:MAG: hypothetical protein P8X57_07555 [Cyclobacteriaceae bacterium]
MNKLVFGVLLILCISGSANAQISNFAGVNGVPLKVNPYEEIEGTPYLNDGNWYAGKFINKYGKTVDDVAMRYNIFEDALECNYQNKAYIFQGKDIREFIYYTIDKDGHQEVYHFKSGMSIPGNVNSDDYVQVLYEGTNIQIFKKYYVDNINVAPAAYGGLKKQRFVRTEKMWLLTSEGIKEISKVYKRMLMNNFPQYEKEIRKFSKVHDVDWTSYSDIYALCNYLDQTIVP